jgi:hypothetical protein
MTEQNQAPGIADDDAQGHAFHKEDDIQDNGPAGPDDVQGHRMRSDDGEDDVQGHGRMRDNSGDDVEGHSFHK